MIRINSKETPYKLASYSFAQNDALEPTGLGSVGVYYGFSDLKLYIGIKNDVIDFITDKNTNFFLNLTDEEISISETLGDDAKFGDGYVREAYINGYKIEIDTALFRKYVYKDAIADYATFFQNRVARDPSHPGAILRLEIPYRLGLDGTFIGLLFTEDEEMLVLNKAIIDKNSIKDDLRYSIWKIKAPFTPHYLDRSHSAMVVEPTDTYEKDSYASHFNDCAKTYFGSKIEKSEFSVVSAGENTASVEEPKRSDLDNDVYIIFNTVLAPGIVNGTNMANFGLKEMRRGYPDLSKNKTFLNIGYTYKNMIFSDSFYVNTSYSRTLEPLSKVELFTSTRVSGPDIGEKVNYKTVAESTSAKTNAEAIEKMKPMLDDMLSTKLFTNEELGLGDKLSVNFGLRYHMTHSDQSIDIGKTVIYTHPFHPFAFAVHVDENNIDKFDETFYISPDSLHAFGFRGNEYYFRSISKEFREYKNHILEFSVYIDLLGYNFKKKLQSGYADNDELMLGLLSGSANVFIIDTERLVDMLGDKVRNSKYPLGRQNNYVRIVK